MAIFNEYTVTALKQNGDYASTAVFVDIILSWWKMMNIKTPFKGAHKRDYLSVPFSSCEDERLLYLERIYDWLSTWEFAKKAGGLTKQTFRAVRHTIATMISFIKYMLNILKVEYVLTGKCQTDNLERRFGLYRQLCGGCYHVTVTQVIEAEKN